MLEKILRKTLPFRVVRRDDYMVRFFLWGSRGDSKGNGRSLRLHHIISSDDDTMYHNHPYHFRSLILWGGYVEHKPNVSSKKFRIGNINNAPLELFHRLELKKPAWTLVWCGPRVQEWGFSPDGTMKNFTHWKDHK